MSGFTVSILVPVYNESATVEAVIRTIARSELPSGAIREIVVVDDASTDGTQGLLARLASELPVRVVRHGNNLGKGAALRTAIQAAAGNILLFQDADLEYDPRDYGPLLTPLIEGRADVVYGSRFLGGGNAEGFHLVRRLANRFLTWLSNRVNRLELTDMETGYKAFRRTVLDGLVIEENGFGVEPEITAKLAPLVRSGSLQLVEVPVSYRPRTHKAGKKIRFRDGVWAIVCIFRYGLLARQVAVPVRAE